MLVACIRSLLAGGPACVDLLSVIKLHTSAQVGRRVVVRGRIWIHGGGELILGNDVVLDGAQAPIELHVQPNARLRVGDRTRIGAGCSIEAVASVDIGSECDLAPFVKVLDNNHHEFEGNRLARPDSVPIVVEDGARIGARAILLPGAYVGRGATITPSTVLARRLPPGATAAGIPASICQGPTLRAVNEKTRP